MGRGLGKTYQRYDDLAVRVRLELVRALEARAQLDVVVNLAVHGEDDLAIVANKGLSASVCEGSDELFTSQVITLLRNAPTPTIARRSCARMVCLPL